MQEKTQILNWNDETIFRANFAITHCISADAKMSARFALTMCRQGSGLQEYCQRAKRIVGAALRYWDPESNNFMYRLVTQSKFHQRPTLDNLRISREKIRGYVLLNNVYKFTKAKIGCRLYNFQ